MLHNEAMYLANKSIGLGFSTETHKLALFTATDFLLSKINKKLSYCKQIARQWHTRYAEDICSNFVTLKSGLEVIQGH